MKKIHHISHLISSIVAILATPQNLTKMLAIFAIVFFPSVVLGAPSLRVLPTPAPGPSSFTFDSNGKGPYTGINDGRILKYKGFRTGFVDYAYTSTNRTKELCDGITDLSLSHTCGRPSAMGFYDETGELFVADYILGLVVVKPKGGVGTIISTGVDGVPFRCLDALEVDQRTGNVYFTDLSAVYNLSQGGDLIVGGDRTGRLMKYDRKTKQVTVLLHELGGASGVALSMDGSYLLVAELTASRVQKYWLKGPKANTAEVLLNVTGIPDKIKRIDENGEFWLAMANPSPPQLMGLRIDGDKGTILESVTFNPVFNASGISEVHQHNGALYLGSLSEGFVGVYKRDSRRYKLENVGLAGAEAST